MLKKRLRDTRVIAWLEKKGKTYQFSGEKENTAREKVKNSLLKGHRKKRNDGGKEDKRKRDGKAKLKIVWRATEPWLFELTGLVNTLLRG